MYAGGEGLGVRWAAGAAEHAQARNIASHPSAVQGKHQDCYGNRYMNFFYYEKWSSINFYSKSL